VRHLGIMQVELSKLSLEGLALELPPHPVDGQLLPSRKAEIRSGEALRGALLMDEQGLHLRGVAASELVLSSLDWHFGKVFLASQRQVKLGGVRVRAESGGTRFDLDLELASVQADRLQLTVGELVVSAELDAVALQVAVHDDPEVGYLRADQALLKELQLRRGDLTISMPVLLVRNLNMDWGGEWFVLEASTLEGETLQLGYRGSVLSANDVAIRAFGLRGDDVKLDEARFGKLVVEARLPPRAPASPAEQGAPSRVPLFDWRLLDGLSGHLNVDVHVDLAVPIIGHRRATHELRVPIDDGTIDYRKLESNLARLEDSLIDFSVRDGGLVLELGLPLIRTRGRGKPILRWPLSPADLELAENRLVRLAVLPNVKPAIQSEAPRPEEEREKDGGPSSFRLRSLSAENIDAVLTLAAARPSPGVSLRVLSFGKLQLTGAVHHDPEAEPRDGMLRGSLANLHAALVGLPLGDSALRGELTLGALHELAVGFVDLVPQRVRATLESLTLRAVAFAAPEHAVATGAGNA
jgi:hypothetical protein